MTALHANILLALIAYLALVVVARYIIAMPWSYSLLWFFWLAWAALSFVALLVWMAFDDVSGYAWLWMLEWPLIAWRKLTRGFVRLAKGDGT